MLVLGFVKHHDWVAASLFHSTVFIFIYIKIHLVQFLFSQNIFLVAKWLAESHTCRRGVGKIRKQRLEFDEFIRLNSAFYWKTTEEGLSSFWWYQIYVFQDNQSLPYLTFYFCRIPECMPSYSMPLLPKYCNKYPKKLDRFSWLKIKYSLFQKQNYKFNFSSYTQVCFSYSTKITLALTYRLELWNKMILNKIV